MTKEELRERIGATEKGKGRIRYDTALMKAVVEYAMPREGTGESLAGVAEELDIKAGTLQRWCSKHRHDANRARRATKPGADALRFVRLGAVIPPTGAAAPVEIAFPGGISVRVPVGFDGPTLSRVLNVIKEAA